MKCIATTCCSLVLLCSFTFADDFKTIDGKEYKNATVTRVEADGIVITTSSGISKVYFTELPKEVQERFPVSLEVRYASLQQRESEILQQIGLAKEAKIHKERRRAKHLNEMNSMTAQLPALHKELDQVRESMRQLENARQLQPPNSVQTLQARNLELNKQEDDLLLRIGEAEHKPKVLGYQLPYLRHRLQDVRQEKSVTEAWKVTHRKVLLVVVAAVSVLVGAIYLWLHGLFG